MPVREERSFRLLISFSPEDHELKEQLVRHLQVLVRFAGIDLWSADHVRAGDDWWHEIDAALDRADVALLLMSANFLASDFLQDVEVPKLFQRHEQGGMTVIPVLLRSCLWQAHPWLGTLKPLPSNKQPIASLQGDDRDRILTNVAADIERYARTISSAKEVTGAPERNNHVFDAQSGNPTHSQASPSSFLLSETDEYSGDARKAQPAESTNRTRVRLPADTDRSLVLRPYQSLRIGRLLDAAQAETEDERPSLFHDSRPKTLLLRLTSPAISRNHLTVRYEGRHRRQDKWSEEDVITFKDMGSSYGTVLQSGRAEHALKPLQDTRQMASPRHTVFTLVLSPSGAAAVLAIRFENEFYDPIAVVDVVRDGFPFEPEPLDIWIWRVLARLRTTAAQLPMSPLITVTEATTFLPGRDFDFWPRAPNVQGEPHWRASFPGFAAERSAEEHDELMREVDGLRRIVNEEKTVWCAMNESNAIQRSGAGPS